ncbi:MAG: hypothetical protein KDM81_21450, partial [Verrucomicrobiae bacterium]|nr:hypothetical protein [Verrucomicrobiae bacterium]
KAINDAIADFNAKAKNVTKGDWTTLLSKESDLIDSATSAVKAAANTQHDPGAPPVVAPGNGMPGGGGPVDGSPGGVAPATPGLSPDNTNGANPSDGKSDLTDLLKSLLGSTPSLGNALGGSNPLNGLSGMNPLSGLGNSGSGTSPLSALSDGVKPLSRQAENTDDGNTKPKPSVTPLNPVTGASPVDAGNGQDPAHAGQGQQVPGSGKTGDHPQIEPAGNTTTPKKTVTLPDGQQVEAPNEKQAAAAQRALDAASPGGDAARKAYDGIAELPGDGKNPGAKVDPSDMAAGDILKWKDKTMVAAGPGLVA